MRLQRAGQRSARPLNCGVSWRPMSHTAIEYSGRRDLRVEDIVALYRANGWSSADRPAELQGALRDCHGLVSARSGGRLIGLGNAISDGHLVVYWWSIIPIYSFTLIFSARV
jgi:hypothetical protein